nr:NADH dehydrogenase subunit 2 [Cerceris albofasciata]
MYKLMLILFMIILNIMSMFMNYNFNLWILMEMNLICFTTLLILTNKNWKNNSIFIYFIMQCLGTILILMKILNLLPNMNLLFMMNLGLMIKMGILPFHKWVILMIEQNSWMMIFMLTTIQKIIPLMFLNSCQLMNYNFYLINMSIIISSFWMMKMYSLKKIITFSSMIHSSWMMILINLNIKIWMIYFFIYSISMFMMSLYFNIYKINNNNNLLKIKNIYKKMIFLMIMLNMMGLPPFSLMWINFSLIWSMILNFDMKSMIILISLILSKLFMLITYMKLSLNLFYMNKFNIKNLNYNNYKKNKLIFILMMIMMFLMLMINFWNWINLLN